MRSWFIDFSSGCEYNVRSTSRFVYSVRSTASSNYNIILKILKFIGKIDFLFEHTFQGQCSTGLNSLLHFRFSSITEPHLWYGSNCWMVFGRLCSLKKSTDVSSVRMTSIKVLQQHFEIPRSSEILVNWFRPRRILI